MDEENLRSLSYNELKIIALEHDILKSIKSKKKDVLLKRLIDFFNKDSNAVCDPKTNQLNLLNSSSSLNLEDVISPKKKKKRNNASKKLDITSEILPAKLNRIELVLGSEGKENVPEPMPIDELSEPPKKRGRKPKGKKQISNEILDASCEKKAYSNETCTNSVMEDNHDNLSSGDTESFEKSNSRRRGRKNKNQLMNKSDEDTTSEDLPDSLDRRGTFVVKCTEDQNIQAPFCESTSSAPSKSNRTVRGRRHKSEESLENVQAPILSAGDPESVRDVSNIETRSESLDKPNSKTRGRRLKSAHIEKKSSSNEETQLQRPADSFGNDEPVISKSNMTPEVNKKSDKKMAKGRKQAYITEDVQEVEKSDKTLGDRRGTFVVSTKEVVETNPDEISEILNNSNTVRRSRRNNSGDSKPCFSKNENSDDSEKSLCNEEALSNDLPIGPIPDGDRRGTFSISKPGTSVVAESPLSSDILTRSQEKKRKRYEFDVNLNKEALSNTISSAQSSPRRITKKAKLVVPVTPLIFQKSIKFLTPPSGVKSNTFNKSAITYTPDPRKKSVSTPMSVKKTPGQFSAKKMPNFAKIHEKAFGKMESLIKYTERKTARNILNSPLNKTFSGLKSNAKSKRSINKTRREQAKSLIPVRSRSPVRLNNKENCTRALKKIPDCSVEKIREKEKAIIKGVRSNKRFMLQMKMRNLAP